VLRTRLHIGTAYFQNGRLDDAVTAIQAVLDDVARAKLESGELLAVAHVNLAAIHGTAGRHAEGLVHAERGVAIYREVMGSDNPQLISALITLGASQARTGQLGPARATFEEAVALGRATQGDDAHLATVLLNLAILDLDDGDAATSLRHADEAVKMLEATVGEQHVELSRGHLRRSNALRALGDLAGATQAARRALATIPASGPASDRAEAFASMGLAERLAEQGEVAEARDLALRALAAHERLGDEEEAAKVRAWLEQHGAG
jgi:tetratricopeptide (TPR) repeat protein